MNNDALSEERDRLLDENAKMRVTAPSKNNSDNSTATKYLRSKVSQPQI